ncbi:DUF2207 domain-containing protein [Galbibacter sp. EGI 63066]|uniref:DUF2207 domain-containing protein n=1 Tax=Galbibacter sp. EGI 63066 TaxID=2993559 RepID=UPI002248CCED|nr:DUF2207 domain-containing protein [Galbibacter sp. EGI 63066]MCX2679096.1 DUF2207 domain-containing protein [Galbibacter sp. EGI 63066]
MRHLLLIVFWLFTSLGFGQDYERIISFHSDIEVEEMGDILITETIEIYAKGNAFKRGLVRKLPLNSRRDGLGRVFRPKYEILGVKRDGTTSKYHLKKEGNYRAIYIGDENVFLDPGTYQYQITYRAENQIRFFENYDEIYWNVNGTEWAFAMENVSASITLPNEAVIQQQACYTGRYGSTQQNCTFEQLTDNKITFEASDELYPLENLSVAVGFQKGLIPTPPPPTFLQKYGPLVLCALFTLLLLFYYIFTWVNFGKDPEKPTVYPQFIPPDNLSPASVGMLKKGIYNNDLVTASLINLARKGYVKIEEDTEQYVWGLFKNQSYTLTKQKEADNDLHKEEAVILNQLFSWENSVVFDGKYDSSIASAVQKYKKAVTKQWNPLIWKGFNAQFWIVPILTAIAFPILYFYLNSRFFMSSNTVVYFIAFVLVNIVLFFVYQWLIRKPAKEKLRLRSSIEGFEMYLKVAEEKQLQHFNPPELTPEVFEKLLPYAIVLEAEKVWGDKFQKMLAQSAVYKNHQPMWYNSSITNFGDFSHSLNSSFSNSVQGSSTSSSSGGSGGGGFSGGGGGGGGGGGW